MEKNSYNLILEPILTEKSNALREEKAKSKTKQYTFRVYKTANKIEIMKAIEKIYNVKPLDCHIVNVRPKLKNQRMKVPGYAPAYKKAIITVAKADKIEIIK